MTNYGKIVSARLTEDEVASLNQFLAKNDYDNVTEFLRAALQGKITGKDVDQIVDNPHVIVDKVVCGMRA